MGTLDVSLFPSLGTFRGLVTELQRTGRVDIDPLIIGRCAVELAHATPAERDDLRQRDLIRDGAEQLVEVLKVLEYGVDELLRRQVRLLVPQEGDAWGLIATAASSCNFDEDCDDPCADEDETFELQGAQRGCCTKGQTLPADPLGIKAFASTTRTRLGRDGEVAISVNPGSFDGCGHLPLHVQPTTP